jgi:hypothetical protein
LLSSGTVTQAIRKFFYNLLAVTSRCVMKTNSPRAVGYLSAPSKSCAQALCRTEDSKRFLKGFFTGNFQGIATWWSLSTEPAQHVLAATYFMR